MGASTRSIRQNGSGRPSARRLNAAVTMVVEKLQPDQIILFGSAARNRMSQGSDIDLLVLKERDDDNDRVRHDRWLCPRTGDQLDVIVMSRATAERHRQSASYVQGAALEQGRTLYVRNGTEPTPTGPTYVRDGERMVKTTRFEPDHARELLETAERRWRTANREEHPADRCKFLQESMEHALKSLITAEGRRVEHTHDLDGLWRQAEGTGERIRAIRRPEQLNTLSRYAGGWRYALPADEDSARTWQKNRLTGADVLNHARSRVPQLIQETKSYMATRKALSTGGPNEGPVDTPRKAEAQETSRRPRGPQR